ncbi:peptidylprolyl isomerase [Novosphingobium lentum]|uniref:peptidylprolyl isomerase n=1 Tax=Novosphingobium lentum TaxID=145287 RepID=UPI00082ACB71|nr:peptidylprolyl isomerase [Novosphingobium lentum]
MLGFFRNFFKSRLGVGFTLGFLILIAIAFASADVTGGNFGGIAGGDRAASVGSERIGTGALEQRLRSAFEREREKDPALTMAQFLSSGAMDDVLGAMIDDAAMWEWGHKHGFGVSDRLVDSEIVKIPAFLGPDGKFSEAQYHQLIGQKGFTDAQVRDDLGKQLMARQVLLPAGFGAVIPLSVVTNYAQLFKERRVGSIAMIPSLAFAPKLPADDKTLQAYYAKNTTRYLQPERRAIRYAVFDEASLKDVPAPTDAEVAASYKANIAAYSPSETRTVTQLIVPTEAAAQAVAAEVAKGTSLEDAARQKGLATSKLPDVTREALSGQTSGMVADAAFAAAQGRLIAPAKSPIGWHLLRVDAINRHTGKTLDQAKAEIVTALSAEKRKAALADVSAKIEEKFDSHGSLADAATSLGLTLSTTDPLLADGSVFGKAGVKGPPELAPLVATAFQMEREGQPQLAEIQAGKKFAIFEVSQITAAAPAQLAQIKDVVARDYATEQGAAGAKAASAKLTAALAKGTPLAEAMKALGVALPGPQPIDLTREQLAAMQQGQQRVPPPLALLFSMAKGTSKQLEAPGHAGWFVISLAQIIPGEVKPGDPIIAAAQQQMNSVTGREYAEELRAAIRTEIGSKRNPAAIRGVTSRLTGGQ